MRKRFERFDEVGIVDETNGFGQDFDEQGCIKLAFFRPHNCECAENECKLSAQFIQIQISSAMC